MIDTPLLHLGKKLEWDLSYTGNFVEKKQMVGVLDPRYARALEV